MMKRGHLECGVSVSYFDSSRKLVLCSVAIVICPGSEFMSNSEDVAGDEAC